MPSSSSSFANLLRLTAANYWGRVKKAHRGRPVLGERRVHAGDRKGGAGGGPRSRLIPPGAPARSGWARRRTMRPLLPPGMAYCAEGKRSEDRDRRPRPHHLDAGDNGLTKTDVEAGECRPHPRTSWPAPSN